MKQYPTNPTCVMSLKCTKEFEMLENNENRGKRKCVISFTSKLSCITRGNDMLIRNLSTVLNNIHE